MGERSERLESGVSLREPLDVRQFEDVLNRIIGAIKEQTLPVHTDASRPEAGDQGRIIFNSTSGQVEYDDGTDWRTVVDGSVT